MTHVYDSAGSYRLRVTESWAGRYAVNGTTGTIADPITTEGDLDPFAAHQVQAVVDT